MAHMRWRCVTNEGIEPISKHVEMRARLLIQKGVIHTERGKARINSMVLD